MGSYDVTCNISQLPITGGTPVRVLFLGRCPYSMDPQNEAALGSGDNGREGCYSTSFWYPRMVPLKAKYYDYGQVTNVEDGLNQLLFWEQLGKDLWKVDQGPNPYHDPASSHNMDWDKMWDVVTEGRLRIKNQYARDDGFKAVPVCAVMIREDVWQALLALQNPWKGYSRRDSYKLVALTLDYYKSQMTEAIKTILAVPLTEWDHEYAKTHPDYRPFRYYSAFQELFLDNNNPAGALGLEFYLRGLIDAIEAGEYTLESPEIQEMIERIAEVQHVKSMYSALRRTWFPGTGQGSQANEFLAEAQFHHAMAMIGYKTTDQDLKRRAEWDPEVDENDNVIPPKPAERLDEKALLDGLRLPEDND